MRIAPLFIAVLIAGFTLHGMLLFMGDLFAHYPEHVTYTKNLSMFNYSYELYGKINQTSESFLKEDPTILDSAILAVTNGWVALTTLFTMPAILIEMAGEMISDTPLVIDGWIMVLISALIWGIFVFAIFRSMFKVDI
jgi:hypothetical protein